MQSGTVAEVDRHLRHLDFPSALLCLLSPGQPSTQLAAHEQAVIATAKITSLMRICAAVKDNAIGDCVELLNSDQLDMLVRLLYQAMVSADNAVASALYKWHEKAVAKSGVGAIMRVLVQHWR